jgi:DhnA family fructose-bisphosphate aldolase class Ia
MMMSAAQNEFFFNREAPSLMTKEIFTHTYQPRGNRGIILRASGAATIAGPDLAAEGPTATVEELLSLSADAVAVSAYIGSPNEHETLRHMANVAGVCRRWQVPLVGVIGVGKDKEKAIHENLGLDDAVSMLHESR